MYIAMTQTKLDDIIDGLRKEGHVPDYETNIDPFVHLFAFISQPPGPPDDDDVADALNDIMRTRGAAIDLARIMAVLGTPARWSLDGWGMQAPPDEYNGTIDEHVGGVIVRPLLFGRQAYSGSMLHHMIDDRSIMQLERPNTAYWATVDDVLAWAKARNASACVVAYGERPSVIDEPVDDYMLPGAALPSASGAAIWLGAEWLTVTADGPSRQPMWGMPDGCVVAMQQTYCLV